MSFHRNKLTVILIILYTILTYVVDYLATHNVDYIISWRMFYWRMNNGFDLFKYVFWLVIPVLFVIHDIDWDYFSVKRLLKRDYFYLAGFVLIGAVCVGLIQYIPELNQSYSAFLVFAGEYKVQSFVINLIWVLSWVIGWEFLHRYVLLNSLQKHFPKYGWILVPILEGGYHLQKPFFEMGGMIVFSVVMSLWALRRKSIWLPLLSHFILEVELIIYLVLIR